MGKTTASESAESLTDRFVYLNWDNQDPRRLILAGPEAIADHALLKKLNVPHAFQVVLDMDYIDKNCFDYHDPIIIPAKTFLSQLV